MSPSPVYGARLLSGLRASTLSGVQIPAPPRVTKAPPEAAREGLSYADVTSTSASAPGPDETYRRNPVIIQIVIDA